MKGYCPDHKLWHEDDEDCPRCGMIRVLFTEPIPLQWAESQLRVQRVPTATQYYYTTTGGTSD